MSTLRAQSRGGTELDAIGAQLRDDGLAYRYRTDDGLAGEKAHSAPARSGTSNR
ncbi:hypothetical protein [Pseudohoeflea suaedae]|uniref:hypothetical protein n=1 Tax=Pseudohoeflea suaedae TaxID=877384 RepID=UPI0019D60F4F|nr:hypothetical protein [Pseudohoeflea suaedae]